MGIEWVDTLEKRRTSMTKYITRTQLNKYLKVMAILDTIMIAEDWLRLVSVVTMDNGYQYIIDNGSGDTVNVIFHEAGTLIKGFDHENELNQFAADEWDDEFFTSTYEGVPDEIMDLLDEEAYENMTFCMWCTDETDEWIQNETEDDDGGREYLLGYIRQNAEDWCEWASDYYDVELDERIVEKVYNGEELSEEDILKLNSEADVKAVLKKIEEIGRL